MAQKRLFLPTEAQNTHFRNREHGQKMDQTLPDYVFDTTLQIKIVTVD